MSLQELNNVMKSIKEADESKSIIIASYISDKIDTIKDANLRKFLTILVFQNSLINFDKAFNTIKKCYPAEVKSLQNKIDNPE